MKIAIAVHGRFHAFDFARGLIRCGHDVTLLTNYPKWAVKRFGIPPERVRSFWAHGVAARLNWSLHDRAHLFYAEAFLHRLFGTWISHQLSKEPWDVVHLFSGVAEESLSSRKIRARLKTMVRASAHIRTQSRILMEEEQRTGRPLDRTSPWMIAREEREYELADCIITLSQFSYDSFSAEGVPPGQTALMVAGVELGDFRPPQSVIDRRCERILSGKPLNVIYVGTFSFQKGMWDMANILQTLKAEPFRFRFVGPMPRETRQVVKDCSGLAEFVPKQPQTKLAKWYADADLFIFPTLQDGFPQVLVQAVASGLPVLTTTNGNGRDVLSENRTGWVLPIRTPEAFIERLRWCNSHREELAAMVRNTYRFQPRTWRDVVADFESLCAERIALNGYQQVI